MYKLIADSLMNPRGSAVHDNMLKTKFEEYGSEVRPKIIAGSFFRANEYIQAQKIRNYLTTSLVNILSPIYSVIMPTTPITAPNIGESRTELGDPNSLLGMLTRPFSLAGLPAISIPAGSQERTAVRVADPWQALTIFRSCICEFCRIPAQIVNAQTIMKSQYHVVRVGNSSMLRMSENLSAHMPERVWIFFAELSDYTYVICSLLQCSKDTDGIVKLTGVYIKSLIL